MSQVKSFSLKSGLAANFLQPVQQFEPGVDVKIQPLHFTHTVGIDCIRIAIQMTFSHLAEVDAQSEVFFLLNNRWLRRPF